MIALYIILGILLLTAAILMIPASVTIAYQDDISLWVSVLGIRIRRIPKKKKPTKLLSYSKKALARKKRKDERKKNRRLKKATKRGKKKISSQTTQTEKNLLHSLALIKRLSSVLLSKAYKHIRIEARRLIISVGTEDAAKTAILFGSINQAAIALLEFLKQTGKLRQTRRSRIAVRANFASDKTAIDVKLVFSIRIYQLLDIALSALKRLIQEKRQKKSEPAPQQNTSKQSV